MKLEIKFRFKDGVHPELKKQINKEIANFVIKRIRFYTPVASGRLKRNWRLTVTKNTFILRNRTKYASYINDGVTKAKDPSKGLMYKRALEDAISYVERRHNIDLKRLYRIERVR